MGGLQNSEDPVTRKTSGAYFWKQPQHVKGRVHNVHNWEGRVSLFR